MGEENVGIKAFEEFKYKKN